MIAIAAHCDQDLWWKYEQVAMHFNQLIIQLRVQALGGLVAASALVGGFLVKGVEQADRRAFRQTAFTLLTVAWVAIAVLDLAYYQLLLRGAVNALLKIEKGCPFQLSTEIDEIAIGPGTFWTSPSTWYYLVPFGALVAYLVLGSARPDSMSRGGTAPSPPASHAPTTAAAVSPKNP